MPRIGSIGNPNKAQSTIEELRLASLTGSTYATALAAIADLTTKEGPQQDIANGVFWCTGVNGLFCFVPLLVGADNTQCRFQIRGWRDIMAVGNPQSVLGVHHWKSFLLWDGVVQACAATGPASGGFYQATTRYCDTFVGTPVDRTINPPGARYIAKPSFGDDEAMTIVVDPMGAPVVTVHGSLNVSGGVATPATSFNMTWYSVNSG